MNDVCMSLIWDKSDDTCKERNEKGTYKTAYFTDMSFVNDCGLSQLFSMGSVFDQRKRINDYFTLSKETIIRRNHLFDELLNNQEMYSNLIECVEDVKNVFSAIRESGMVSTIEQRIMTVKNINSYIRIITNFHNSMSDKSLKSEALIEFKNKIDQIYCDTKFKDITENFQPVHEKINSIQSITLGVNLDSELMPSDVALISINSERYKSGNFVDRLMSKDFSKKEFQSIAPLVPSIRGQKDESYVRYMAAINKVVGDYLAKATKHMAGNVSQFLTEQTSWLVELTEEFAFIKSCMTVLLDIKKKGLPLAVPEIGDNVELHDFYNVELGRALEAGELVSSDVTFDSKGEIYILAGSNQGGKTVFVRALGITYGMLHLGMLLPASRAKIALVDNIFTHFCTDSKDINKEGRFASECDRVSVVSQKITKNSIFLFDETFSSTSEYDGAIIAKEVLTAYAVIGAKGVFATHFHSLETETENINKVEGVISKLDNLCTTLDKDTGNSSFKICRGVSDGSSHAKNICLKYHLTKEEILKR